jgi:hypothetical protein
VSPSAIGARRRITALFCLGWSPRSLEDATGIPAEVFTRGARDLRTRTAPEMLPKIGEAYERLWNARPPMDTDEDQAEAQLFAEHASSVGWAPPMAYDDDTIDDPAGGPAQGWRRNRGGHEPRRTVASLAEDVEWIREHGGYRHASLDQLAMRLGMTRGGLERGLIRYKHQTGELSEAS